MDLQSGETRLWTEETKRTEVHGVRRRQKDKREQAGAGNCRVLLKRRKWKCSGKATLDSVLNEAPTSFSFLIFEANIRGFLSICFCAPSQFPPGRQLGARVHWSEVTSRGDMHLAGYATVHWSPPKAHLTDTIGSEEDRAEPVGD